LASNETHTMIFVYALYVRQTHNSMVFARDVTEQFGATPKDGEFIRLFLSGTLDTVTTLVAASNQEIRLYDIIYYNRLSLNQALLP
jgi:hypothetical protein